MAVLLDTHPDAARTEIPPRSVPPTGGGEGPRPDPLPAWVAVTIVVVVAIILTYIGMLTQIWANMSGAQLPGA
jgi:hypothetical protein